MPKFYIIAVNETDQRRYYILSHKESANELKIDADTIARIAIPKTALMKMTSLYWSLGNRLCIKFASCFQENDNGIALINRRM